MDIGGQGGQAFPFDKIGDSVTGKITNMEEIQQTEIDSGLPAVWPDGKPKMQYRVTLQTDLSSELDDDGVRAVYLRGSRKADSQSSLAAVLAAVKAATGGSALDVSGTLTLTYIGDGQPAQRGFNAPKFYSASYRPPSTDLGGSQASAQQAPAPAQAQQANGAQGALKGMLGTKPIDQSQYAAMVAAGADPAQLPGWIPLG
jgi:hypothetical protein